MSGHDEHNLPDYENGEKVAQQAFLAFTLIAVLIGIVAGGYFFFTRDTSTVDEAADKPSPSASETTTPAGIPSVDPDNPCPEVTVEPNTSPKQFEAVAAKDTAPKNGAAYTIKTTCGDIVVELNSELAPQASANFAFLAKEKFYNDSLCHRLTTQGIFVLQCGDPTATGKGSPGYSFGPIENAPENNVYEPGTLAMARTGNNGESMGSQFFLVYDSSPIPADSAGGYTVFGKITQGLDIVKKVAEGGSVVPGQDGSVTKFSDGKPWRPIAITEVVANG